MPTTQAQQEHLDRTAGRSVEEVTFLNLLRSFGIIERVMQTHFTRFGITGSQWGVLRILHRAESFDAGGVRLTDLSERLLVRPPSVTGLVARLVRDGWVMTDVSPTDQRAKRVQLTPAGRSLVTGSIGAHREQVRKIMGGLSVEACGQLHTLLEQLGGHLESLLENES